MDQQENVHDRRCQEMVRRVRRVLEQCKRYTLSARLDTGRGGRNSLLPPDPSPSHHSFLGDISCRYLQRSDAYKSICHFGFAFLTCSHTCSIFASVKINQRGCRRCAAASIHSFVMIWIIGWTRGGFELVTYGANFALTSF